MILYCAFGCFIEFKALNLPHSIFFSTFEAILQNTLSR